MIDCKGCPDKMKCVTGEVKQCRRGLKLKRCCREYLTSRRKHLFRTILKIPEEMIKDNEIVIEEVCSACGEKITIRLKIKAGFDYTEQLKDIGSKPWTAKKISADEYDKGYPHFTTSSANSKPIGVTANKFVGGTTK